MSPDTFKQLTFSWILLVCLAYLAPSVYGEEVSDRLSLAACINLTIDRHASIKQADEAVTGALFNKKAARSDFFVRASAGWSYTRLDEKPVMKLDPSELSPPGAPVIPGRIPVQIADKDQFHWDITLVQPLFTGLALSSLYDMASLNLETKKWEKQQATLNLIRDVKTAYYNVLLTWKILLVADDAVRSLESHENDARRLFEQGLIRNNDLLRAKVALAQVKQDRERARGGARMAMSSLNTLLNLDLNRHTPVDDIHSVPVYTYSLDASISEAIENRPLFKILSLAMSTIEDVIKIEKSSRFPQLALIGVYEQNGENPLANENTYSNYRQASITLEARWHFFRGGKTRHRVFKAIQDKKILRERIKQAEDGIRLEVKNAFLDLQIAEKNIETANEALSQAKENWRITNLQYRQRVTTSTEVLDARTFLTDAETNYYEALYGYGISLAGLERAIGRENRSH